MFVISIVLSFALASNTLAQTEIEGEVSGVWNIDGSPYIQVGEVNVPDGDELIIESGVRVILSQEEPFVIRGSLNATGTEEDSIYFQPVDTGRVATLRGESGNLQFTFCRFDSFYTSLTMTGGRIEIRNSLFYDNRRAYITRDGGERLECHNNVFIMSDDLNCIFTVGQDPNGGGRYYITGNRWSKGGIGGVHVDSLLVENNELDGTGGDGGWICIRNNTVRESINLTVVETGLVEQNRIGWRLQWNPFPMWLRNEQVIRDNEVPVLQLYYGRYQLDGNNSNGAFLQNVHGCLLGNLFHGGGLVLRDTSVVELENNTIVRKPSGDGQTYATISIGGDFNQPPGTNRVTMLSNNILMELRGFEMAVDSFITVEDGGYNCFWGAERPYGVERDLLEGDIVADPCFIGGHPYEYELQANSPCIDAGDPDSPNDPDGTRADIGAYFYDQENGMPPAIISRHDAYTGWEMDFRYVARVTDWEGALEFEFDGLPQWLQVEEDRLRRDFVADSVVLAGQVPNDQNDFVFTVTARDEDGLEDTLSVQVFVYPMTVLTGQIGGVLTREGSPYIVADTAWVAEDECLTVEPGSQIYFANERYEDRWSASINVYGDIRLVGTEQDSIIFDHFPGTPGTARLNIYGDSETPVEFCYCWFKDLSIRSQNNREFVITHCRNDSGGYVMGGENARYLVEHNANQLGLFTGNGIVRNNCGNSAISIMGGDSTQIYGNHWNRGDMYIRALRFASVHHNIIDSCLNQEAITVNDDNPETLCTYSIHNNVIGFCNIGIRIYGNSDSIIVSNNLISQSTTYGGIQLVAREYDAVISNNIITRSKRAVWVDPVRGNEMPETIILENNLIIDVDSIFHNPRNIDYNAFYYNAVFDFDSLGLDNWIGVIDTTNQNGDSTDAGFNLFLNPQVVSLDSLDFRLYQSSPLIDAGSPDSIFNDVDGSVNDIGLFGGHFGESYDYPVGVGNSGITPPEGFAMSQPYPNPFNSQVHFLFTLPKEGGVEIKVYDITGRLVFSKSLDRLAAGSHRYVWTGTDNARCVLPTGIYYFELTFESAKLVKPMVMVK